MSDVSQYRAYAEPDYHNTSWWYYGAYGYYGYHAEKDYLEDAGYHEASESGYDAFPDDHWDAEAQNELGSLICELLIVVAVAWAIVV